MKIHFIFPPIWECDTPYISIPCLAAYLHKAGHQVTAIDLNIKIQNKILNSEEQKRIVARLRKMLVCEIDAEKKKHIQEVMALADMVDFQVFDQAKDILKTSIEIKEIVWAKRILEIGRYIYSAQYFPAQFFSNEYSISGNRISSISSLMKIVNRSDRNVFSGYLKRYAKNISGKFDVIGISVAGTNQLIAAFTLAKYIKQEDSGVKICLGGAVLPYMRNSIYHSPELFHWFDYMIVGEGESALLRLLEFFEDKCDINDVPNILYAKNGQVIKAKGKMCENVHKLPTVDYSYVEWDDYFFKDKVISYLASRGCYWNKCSFCGLTANYGQKYRVKNAEQIVSELEELSNTNNCRYIVFNDEALTAFEIKSIAEEILRRDLKIYWSCLCRLDKQHNKETFQLAYKAGLRIISFGLENGSQKVLDLMNKGIELEIAQRVIRNSSEAGIWNNIYLMLGFPGETEEDIQHTKKFLEESESYIDTLGYGEFRLDGYSKVFRQPEKYGIWIEKYSKDYFGPDYSFKRNSNNSLEYIKQFEKYLLKFKFHPSYFIGIDLNILLTNLSQNRKDIIKEQIILSNKHRQAAYLLTSGSFSDIYVKSCIENYKCIDNEREKVYLFYSRLSGMSIQLIGDLDILLHEAKKGSMLNVIIKKYLEKYKGACDYQLLEDFLKNVVFHLSNIELMRVEERVKKWR